MFLMREIGRDSHLQAEKSPSIKFEDFSIKKGLFLGQKRATEEKFHSL